MIKHIILACFLLLASCVTTSIPKSDPRLVCSIYEECIVSLTMKPIASVNLKREECIAQSDANGIYQDVAAMHCEGLSPCAFTLCMRSHLFARGDAVEKSMGK